jgi:hypothetical protein
MIEGAWIGAYTAAGAETAKIIKHAVEKYERKMKKNRKNRKP